MSHIEPTGLAKEHPVDADIVVPVPESGRRYATGYSRESKIPIDDGLMKDKDERSFIQQTQESRDKLVDEGISYIRSVLQGKRVVLVDDSIVRGTNIRKLVSGIRNAGAKEVHVRIGCPPLIAPCYLGIDMRSKKEFLARDEKGNIKTSEQIAKEINADSLTYLSMQGLKKAIGFDICKGGIDFRDGYPPDMKEDVTKLFKVNGKGIRAYECRETTKSEGEKKEKEIMKTQQEWKGEIEQLLNNKVASAVAQIESQKERSFSELAELSAQQDALLAEKKGLEEEKGKLNPLKNADLKEINLQALRLQKLEKQLRSLRKRIDGLLAELTEVPENISLLVFLKSKRGVEYDRL